MNKEINIAFEEFEDISFLNNADQELVLKARETTANAYAPYSGFKVAAAARMKDGSVFLGTNQENASYPVGICAERTLLAYVGTLFTDAAIDTMAISYFNTEGNSNEPVTPCGMCRQALLEYENRTKSSIRLILTGTTGKVIVMEKASYLLPLSFSAEHMG